MPGVLHCRQAPTRNRAPFKTNGLEARASQVCLQDECIVSCAKQDAIIFLNHRHRRSYLLAVTVISIRAVPTSLATPTVVRAGRGSLK